MKNLFSIVLLLNCLLFFTTVMSCDNSSKESKSTRRELSSPSVVNITVGSYAYKELRPENEELIEHYESLDYFVDGKFLGNSKDGAKEVLKILQSLDAGVKIEIQNPSAGFLLATSRQSGGRDMNYKYPVIFDKELRHKIISELDRIRGWKDDTKAIGLPE